MSNKVKVSNSFRNKAVKAVFSIILFLLVYLIILTLAISLTVACVVGGILLILVKPMWLTFLIGFGLMGFGSFIFIFLVKFIFKSHKIDTTHMIKIEQRDEPFLFEFISEIVQQVKTKYPKTVYLTGEVNASVFYNSSFWSMFFPTRKNLQIGIGLANSCSKNELKAVLSHEFGHFSQKSMALGSYVYNVNNIIYNLLFENEGYNKSLQKFSQIHGVFALFTLAAIKIIEGIQWILRKMYQVVNLSYLDLSREMEFHADAIAATVSGSQPLIDYFLRMNLAVFSFNAILSHYDNLIDENLISENVYKEQAFVMKFQASQNHIMCKNELPQVTEEYLYRFNKSKLFIKDQWSSHPSTQERIEALKKLHFIQEEESVELANNLFSNVIKWQKFFTKQLFDQITYSSDITYNTLQQFKKQYSEKYKEDTFDNIYNCYYDNKNPLYFDVNEYKNTENHSLKMEHLFGNKKIDLVYSYNDLITDISVLEQIKEKTFKIKTYDYDGKRYRAKDTSSLLEQLRSEEITLAQKIRENDIHIFIFFHNLAKKQGKQNILEEKYKQYFEYNVLYERKISYHTSLLNSLTFINIETPFEKIEENMGNIGRLEIGFKEEIKDLLNHEIFENDITETFKSNLEKYISEKWSYFFRPHYDNEALNILYTALNDYSYLLETKYFNLKKELLSFQKELLLTNKELSVGQTFE